MNCDIMVDHWKEKKLTIIGFLTSLGFDKRLTRILRFLARPLSGRNVSGTENERYVMNETISMRQGSE